LDLPSPACANLVRTQPSPIRHRREDRKWRLIQALGDWLAEVTWRRPKQGLTLPFATWLLRLLRERVGQELWSLTTCFPFSRAKGVQ
jgi:hypothetical protein